MLERAEDGRQIDPPASSYAIMQRASPYCGENPGPGKDVRGELEPRPGIREQPGSLAPDERSQQLRRMSASPPIAPLMCRLLPSGRKADMGEPRESSWRAATVIYGLLASTML